MADSTKWCVELVHQVGSPRVKVLYDIYHAAMMKENVRRHQEHHDCWGHYHTGGVPGRNEIDGTQTLDYASSCGRSPTRLTPATWARSSFPRSPTPSKSLAEAVAICDV